jgi:hypothetical protein
MAAIGFAYCERNTVVSSNTSSMTDVTDMSIPEADLVDGADYLIMATAATGNVTSGGLTSVQIVHGSTAFSDSLHQWTFQNANTEASRYMWFTKWTAVAGEGLKMQKQNSGGTTSTVNFAAIAAIKISDLTENTDWFYNERSIDDTITTTPTAGGSVTFTPGTAGQNWLVMTNAAVSHVSNATSVNSRLDRSGEASSTQPSTIWAKASTGTATLQHTLFRAFSLGTSSNTFREMISASSGTSHTRLHSRVFALNLSVFDASAVAYTASDANLSASDYATELQTVTITPPTTSTCFVLSGFIADIGAVGREAEQRLQFYVDGGAQSDVPAGQTTANYQFHQTSNSSGNELAYYWFTKSSVTSGNTYRADLDASSDSTTSTPSAQDRQLVLFTAELAAENRLIEAGSSSYTLSGQELILRRGSRTFLRYGK